MKQKTGKRPLHISEIRAIAVDLDGTILRGDSTLSTRTETTLCRLRSQGLKLILCTGRSPLSAEPFRIALGAEGPMVYYNGAAVVEMPKFEIKAASYLDADIALYCARRARELDIHYHVFLSQDRLFYEKRRSEAVAYEERNRLTGELGDFEAIFASGGEGSSGCIKGMFIADPAILEQLCMELESTFAGRVYCARSHHNFLEVLNSAVSKGNGLRIALALAGLESRQVIAFGDAENDIPLLEAAGFSVAMGNAELPVQKVADAVCLPNQEDGVALFLEQIFNGHTGSSIA